MAQSQLNAAATAGAAQTSPLVGAPLGRTMLRLAVPGVIGALIQSAIMMVEAGFLRHVGTEALAGVALVFPLIMMAAMFSAGAIGGAVSGSVARAAGAGDSDRASHILAAAIVISVVAGSLMSILVIVFGPQLYQWASNSELVVAAAIEYAKIVFLAMPLFWMLNMLSSVLRGTGDMIRPAIGMAVLMVSYTVYASLLIPQSSNELLPAMRAAAYSMVLSYVTALAVVIYFIARKQQPIRLVRGSFKKLAVLGAVLKQGTLASSQSLMTIIYALIATSLFSRFSTDWLAGYGLAVRLELIMVPLIFGIGSSLIAIVGAHVGAGLHSRAVAIAWRGVLINALVVGAIGILLALQPQWWCGNLASTEAVADHCAQSLRTIGPTYGFFALGLGCYFASQGLNTLVYPVTGALLRLLIVASGLLWVSESTSPQTLLFIVAGAVVSYGLFVVMALKIGPWRGTTGS